jgi:hypothetical protein
MDVQFDILGCCRMADKYVFADEAGNFDFSRRQGASRYFILCTITATHCEVGDALLSLRRDLGWRGLHLDRVFHATEDPQSVRDEVFALLADMDCFIDATILEKSKAQPHLKDQERLYKMAWYLHFKQLAWHMSSTDRLFVAASSLGTKKARHALHTAVDEVVLQLSPCVRIGWRSGPPTAIRAYKWPTTARGPFNASGSETTTDRTR